MSDTINLSIVIPIYNEEKNINHLYDRLNAVLRDLGRSYEIVLINDGSRDKSAEILNELHKQDEEHLKIIHFNGNFGQHMAIMAGFENSTGDIVVTLDADLQNPPEEIPKILAKMDEGHDVVEGIRHIRKDNMFRRYASKLNNAIRQRITNIKLIDQGCMLRAYARPIVDLIVKTKEHSAYIPALGYSYASNPGFINVDHSERAAGTSQYNLATLLRLNFDLMAGFSSAPLQFVTFTGMSASVVSFLFFIYMIIRRLIVGPEVEGLFTLFALLFFMSGLILFCLGVVGEYVGRIYMEVRNRPRFVIKKILNRKT